MKFPPCQWSPDARQTAVPATDTTTRKSVSRRNSCRRQHCDVTSKYGQKYLANECNDWSTNPTWSKTCCNYELYPVISVYYLNFCITRISIEKVSAISCIDRISLAKKHADEEDAHRTLARRHLKFLLRFCTRRKMHLVMLNKIQMLTRGKTLKDQ